MQHYIYLILVLFTNISYSQSKIDRADYFPQIPYKNGQIIYEKIITLDSVNNKELVYNAAKSALIQNTSYKYSKVDEDRYAGSISTEIQYLVTTQAAIRFVISATSLLSIDVKENRFRIRITNSNGQYQFMGERMIISHVSSYEGELEQIKKGKKWKAVNSYAVMWDLKIKEILDAFSVLIAKGVNDDF